jgi:hypothetical protein
VRVGAQVDYPGEVAAPPPTQFSFASKGKGKAGGAAAAGEGKEQKKGGAKRGKRGGKRSSAESVGGSSIATGDDASTVSGTSRTSKGSRASRGEQHTDSAAEEGLSAEQAVLDGMHSLGLADGASGAGEGGSLAEGFEEDQDGWEEGDMDDGLDALDDPDEGEEGWEATDNAEGEAGEEDGAAAREGDDAGEGAEEARTDGEEEGELDADGATGEAATGTAAHTETGSQAGSSHTKPKGAKKARPLRVDWDGVFPYLYCGSALASMFQACLHAEHPHAFYEAARRHSATFAASEGAASADPLLLHPDLDLQYLVPPAPELAEDGSAAADSRGDHSADSHSLAGSAPSFHAGSAATSKHAHVVSADSISFAVRALQAEGICAFLADAVVAPKRSARDCALPVSAWHAVLRLLVRGLKTDFDALQAWR